MRGLRDVAKAAGVSIATASHVLNGTKAVRPQVAERVLSVAQSLGYHLNRTGRTLRTGRSHTVGLLVPDLTNPFFPQFAQAVARATHELGYALLLFDSGNDPTIEATALDLLAEYRVDGAIWIPTGTQAPFVPPFPLVVVDRPLDGITDADLIQADHEGGGTLLAAYATRLGHEYVGLLSGPQSLASARQRRCGFITEATGRLNVVWEAEVPFSVELSRDAEAKIAEGGVSLIAAANDMVAIGALRVLKHVGKRVPEDVSVLGFDDIPWASLVNPPLTTVRQSLAGLGKVAVHKLVSRLENPSRPPERVVLAVELEERASARKVTR